MCLLSILLKTLTFNEGKPKKESQLAFHFELREDCTQELEWWIKSLVEARNHKHRYGV